MVIAQLVTNSDSAGMVLAIAEVMAVKGVNAATLAMRLDTPPIQVSRLLKGQRKMTVEWLKRIADALGVTIGDLLTTEHNPHRLDDQDRAVISSFRLIEEPVRQRVPAVLAALAGQRATDPFEADIVRKARGLDAAGRARLEKLIEAAA